MIPSPEFEKLLRDLKACHPAQHWAEGLSLTEAWETCDRAAWMLWLAAAVGVSHRTIVMATCACSRAALRFIPPGEGRPLQAILSAERQVFPRDLRLHQEAAQDAAREFRDQGMHAAMYAARSTVHSPAQHLSTDVLDELEISVRYARMAGCTEEELTEIVRAWIPVQMVHDAYRNFV